MNGALRLARNADSPGVCLWPRGPSVGLSASLAVLVEADAMKVGQLGPMSAEGVQATMTRGRVFESLGG
jgi:hypothetical protein